MNDKWNDSKPRWNGKAKKPKVERVLMFEKPFVIAEIGSNWCKSDSKEDNYFQALYQIEQAKECGADAVKFQLFTHKELYGFEDQYSKLNKYCLPKEWIPELKQKCNTEHIEFMCSCFSIDSYKYINEYVNMHKVACPESNWYELFDILQEFNKPVIVSTEAFNIELDSKIRFYQMRTVSQYPANPRKYKRLNLYDGISDHTKSFHLIDDSLREGIHLFEVHVDLSDDTKIKTPDSVVSLNKSEFTEYIMRVHNMKDIDKPNYYRSQNQYGYYRKRT